MTRRAFTLLEVVLAVAVLATVCTLAALAISQARSWSDAQSQQARALRLARLGEMFNRQWADRRNAAPVSQSGGSAVVEPKRLEFLTATPILHTRWPLVVAAYVIKEDFSPGKGPGRRYRLEYEEARVSRLGVGSQAEASQLKTPATADEKPLTAVLLTDCRDLRFERFGMKFSPTERQRRAEQGVQDRNEQEEQPAWHPFEENFDGPIPAVRLVGFAGERARQEFSCVFVVEVSRSLSR
ncbi:MAG: type II secretion system protein [Planctomycetes bacterium]|nr:type II secretion system protein [Planctomycetota bacterium]